MKNFMTWTLCVALLLVLPATGLISNHAKGSEAASFSLATSSTGSVPYIISVGIADLITRDTGINISVQSFGGSDASARAVRDKHMLLAMVNTPTAYNSFHGEVQFAREKPAASLRLLLQGNLTPRYLVVRESAGINSFQDLAGKTIVGRRPSLADIAAVANAYFQLGGLEEKDVKVVETTESNEALNALRSGAVAGIVNPTNPTAAAFQQVARAVPLVILALTEEQVKAPAIQALFKKGFTLMTLKTGSHKLRNATGIIKAGPVLATRMAIMAGKDLPDEIAYKMVMSVHKNQDQLKSIHALARQWTVKNTLDNPPIPFHGGAVKAFKEIGVWNDKLDRLQSSEPGN
ncbi:MAG: TAXI family TRAP transporter solute-binding subunit [Desulfobacterales bacterium]|nr:TAXI family TRAP transporter solute-binding subunit [Desulfobacterales bacterium]